MQAQLAQLAERIPSKAAADPRLLDQLPVIDTDLGRLPEDLERELYGGFQLQVRYHHPSRRVTLRVTIDGAAIPQLTATGRAIMADRPTEASRSGTEPRNAESRPTTVSAVEGRDGFPLQGVVPAEKYVRAVQRASRSVQEGSWFRGIDLVSRSACPACSSSWVTAR